MNELTNICSYYRTFGVGSSLSPGPRTFQILRPEAIGEQCSDAGLLNAAIRLSFSQPFLVVAGDEENRHGLCAELADDLATQAAGRERGCNIAIGLLQ